MDSIYNIVGHNITSLQQIVIPYGTTKLVADGNMLTDLKGCPDGVSILFVSGNRLTSLEGCPDSVEYLNVSSNNLTSLKFCPKNVKTIICSFNNIESFEHCPESVHDLYIASNKIKNFEHCPKSLKTLNIAANKLKSLIGCPRGIIDLIVSKNKLGTLYGCPITVVNLTANTCELVSTKYLPKSVSKAHMTNIDDTTAVLIDGSDVIYERDHYGPYCMPLSDIHEKNIIAYVDDFYTAVSFIKRTIRRHRCAITIQKKWRKWWYEPDDQGVSRFCKYSVNELADLID